VKFCQDLIEAVVGGWTQAFLKVETGSIFMRRKHKKLYELAPEPDALLAWHNFLKGWQLNPVQAGKHGNRKIGKYIPTNTLPGDQCFVELPRADNHVGLFKASGFLHYGANGKCHMKGIGGLGLGARMVFSYFGIGPVLPASCFSRRT
jgi:hypothetical protein